MHVTVSLTVPADVRLLPATRRFFGEYLRAMGTASDVVDDVVLALDEACSNVVLHAFPGGGGSYRLRADLRPLELVIEVEDDGVGFEPMGRLGRPALRPPGGGVVDLSGRGFLIMRRLMTSVEVESPTRGGGTRLRMRRRLAAPAYAAAPVT